MSSIEGPCFHFYKLLWISKINGVPSHNWACHRFSYPQLWAVQDTVQLPHRRYVAAIRNRKTFFPPTKTPLRPGHTFLPMIRSCHAHTQTRNTLMPSNNKIITRTHRHHHTIAPNGKRGEQQANENFLHPKHIEPSAVAIQAQETKTDLLIGVELLSLPLPFSLLPLPSLRLFGLGVVCRRKSELEMNGLEPHAIFSAAKRDNQHQHSSHGYAALYCTMLSIHISV